MDLLLGPFSPRGGSGSASDSDSGSHKQQQQQPSASSPPFRGALEDLSELAQAQNVLSTAARRAGSLLWSLQTALESVVDFQEDEEDGEDQDPRLPWVPRNPDEQPFARQLRSRMMGVAEEPELFLEQSHESCNIDVTSAITEAAGAVLERDHELRALRFRLVPKHIPEEVFWARYFGICNRIRKEVLLAGVSDSQVLSTGGSDTAGDPEEMPVHVPLSPEASLNEERYRRPEATEEAGRWLETASEPPQPQPQPQRSRPQKARPPRTATRTKEEKPPPAPQRADSDDSLWGLIAGEDGGLMPPAAAAAAPGGGGGGAASSFSSSSMASGRSSGRGSGVGSPVAMSLSLASSAGSCGRLSSDPGPYSSAPPSGITSPEMGQSSVLQGGSSSFLSSGSSSSQAFDATATDASAAKQPVPKPPSTHHEAHPAAAKGRDGGSSAAPKKPLTSPPPQGPSRKEEKGRRKPSLPPMLPPSTTINSSSSSSSGMTTMVSGSSYPAPSGAQRLRRMADTLAAARLLCLEDMARLNISPPAAHAEATGTWGGAILRAVGAGRGGAAAAAVVASVAEQPGATQQPGFSSRRRLRLSLAGGNKAPSPEGPEQDAREDQVTAAIWKLFEPMSQSPVVMSPRTPGSSSSDAVPWGLPTDTAAVELTGWSLESEVGGAPPRGFLSAVVSSLCRLATVGQMAQFWSEVVEELQCQWSSLRPVPGVPTEHPPDLGVCLLQQRLQLLNIAITLRRAQQQQQQQQQMSPSGKQKKSPASTASSPPACREGSARCLSRLPLSDGSGPVWSPQLQRAVAFHQDLCHEFPCLSQCVQGPASTLRQALSDMSAFRAANPTALPCDYEAWCSTEGRPGPLQHLGPLLARTPCAEYYPLRHLPKHHRPARHHQLHPGLSSAATGGGGGFQLHPPTAWDDLFWSAPPLPAAQQAPLFDAEAIGAAVLESIRAMVPSDVFEQLFLVAVVMEHADAAASPLLHVNQALETALHEVRCFAATACARGMSESKVSRICHVFERLQDMFEAVSKDEHKKDGSSWPSRSGDPATSGGSLSFMEVEDEWTMV